MKRKVTAILLAAVLCIGLCSSCGKEPDKDKKTADVTVATTATTKEGTTATEADTKAQAKYPRDENGNPDFGGMTFTIWEVNYRSNVTNNYADFQVIKDMEEKFNCKFEFIHPPVGQEKDNFAIMLADNKLPDLLFSGSIDNYYPGGLEMAYDDGILYDYTGDINEVNTPNFCNIVLSDEYLRKLATDDKNRLVRLGAKIAGSKEGAFQFNGLTVRSDYLKKTGLDMPETIGDWYELLTAFKKEGIEFPLLADNNRYLTAFAPAYGILADEYFIDSSKKVAFGPDTAGFDAYVTELNKWYTEGLINSDYMNITENDALAIYSNDRAGSAEIHYANWQTTYYTQVEEADPSKALIGAQIPKLNEGDNLTNLRHGVRSFGDYKYITADAKDPIACVELLDALYNEEISKANSFGIEGYGYTIKGGYPINETIPDTAPIEDRLKAGITEWHIYEDDNNDMILNYKYSKSGVPAGLQLMAKCGTDGRLPKALYYTKEEADVMSSYRADIQTYVDEMTMKFITGATPLDQLPAYHEQLKALHIDDMVALTQAALDRYNNR